MEVEPLPQLIRLVVLPVDVAERCLLAAFFKVGLSGAHGEGFFFTYTQAVDEVSLLLDEGSFDRVMASKQVRAVLPRDHESVSQLRWRALRVYTGCSGVMESGILSLITAPLAACAIPVLNLCTFDSDLLFVPNAEVERATAIIEGLGGGGGGGTGGGQAVAQSLPALAPATPAATAAGATEDGGEVEEGGEAEKGEEEGAGEGGEKEEGEVEGEQAAAAAAAAAAAVGAGQSPLPPPPPPQQEEERDEDGEGAEEAAAAPAPLPAPPAPLARPRLTHVEGNLQIASMRADAQTLRENCFAIMHAVIYSAERSPRFFSITLLDQEASLLLDSRAIAEFEPGALSGVLQSGVLHPEEAGAGEERGEFWQLVRLEQEGHINEPGMLAKMCAPLGAHGISVLAITTSTVYLLVLTSELARAKALLREHGFEVT